jgi:hypothetical protein
MNLRAYALQSHKQAFVELCQIAQIHVYASIQCKLPSQDFLRVPGSAGFYFLRTFQYLIKARGHSSS